MFYEGGCRTSLFGYYGDMTLNEHGERIATTEAEALHSCAWCERMDTPLYRETCLAGHGCNTERDTETLAHRIA